MISADIRIKNPDENIFLGVDAKVTIHAEEADNVVVLPSEVVNIGKEGSFCYVLENGVITKKDITTGISSDEYVEVLDGIKEGDEVIRDLGSLEEGMQAEAASMLITLKETYSALKRIGVEDKKKMVILGDGPVALAFLSCAKLMGIQEIYVLGNHRDKLETAEKLGAAGTFLNKDEEEKKKASDLFDRKSDICIDTIGSNQTITQCLDYIKETGTIAVYGLKSGENLNVPLPELRNFNIQYVQWPVPEVEAEVHKPVCDAIMDGKIDIDLFVTHRFSIDDYEKGFQAVKDRTALKVVLNF